jgi:hypothetical protein
MYSIYTLWGCGRSENSLTVRSLSRRGEQNKPPMIPSHWLPIPITLTSHGGSISIRVGSLESSQVITPSPADDEIHHCTAPVGLRPGAAHGSGSPTAGSFLQCQGNIIMKLTIIWRPSSESVAGEVVRSSTYISMPMLHTTCMFPNTAFFVVCADLRPSPMPMDCCSSVSLLVLHRIIVKQHGIAIHFVSCWSTL